MERSVWQYLKATDIDQGDSLIVFNQMIHFFQEQTVLSPLGTTSYLQGDRGKWLTSSMLIEGGGKGLRSPTQLHAGSHCVMSGLVWETVLVMALLSSS